MLTISSGHSADYLTGPVAHGRESYYTGAVDAGEPPGRWSGQYAATHGLVGEVDHQDMSALFKLFIDPADPRFRTPADWAEARTLGRPPRRYTGPGQATEALLDAEPDATPERRAEIRQEAARGTRHPVAFHDATYSVQKSITVAHAAFEAQEVAARTAGDTDAADAWMAHRLAVEDAIWAGNAAALEYLTDRAGYSRVGHHSTAGGRYIDAHDFTIASFFQHTNRENEPQLHIHNAILNRVLCSDGEWRTVDSRALYRYRGSAGAIAERVTEEHLTRSLGVTFRTRPDGKAREIVGGPALEKAMEMFSTRRRAITGKTAELVAAYRARFDHEPTPLERDRLQRQATFATRKAKSHDGETLDERLDRWDRSLRAELAGGLRQVAHDIVDRRQAQPDVPTFSPSAVIETALADVQAGRATYNQGDLTRAISGALPDHLGADSPAMIRRLLEALVVEALQPSNVVDLTGPAPRALPEELRLADGRSVYEAPAGTRYSTADHMDSERALRQATVETGAPALDEAAARAFVVQLADEGVPLGEDQAGAVTGFLTSGSKIEALLGPAGTGKSYTIAAMTRAWQDPALWDGLQRRVFGLAASQVATDVLAAEGVRACNVARWLATQDRLAAGQHSADDADWWLDEGDVVFVDESAMTSTADLTAVHRHAAAARAKMMMVGDPRQLAAVGPGGAMAMVAGRGRTYELADVRRFDAEWERAASLRLRDGDQTVLPTYRKQGRLVDGGTAEEAAGAAARGWLADTLDGKRSTLTVDTNEQALALSARLRAQLVDLGRVEEAGVPLSGGLTAGVGDLVQARRNAWHLAGFEGNTRGPINRETYAVTAIRDDGGLVARRADGTPITLPGSYVAEHVSLGYASTVHSAQGMTVDTAHCVVTSRSSAGSLYVAMTRGRQCNTAYVQTVVEQEDAPPGDGWKAGRRDPAAVVADVLEREQESMSALAEQAQLDEEARSLRTIGARLAGETEMIAAARTSRTLDELAAAGHISNAQRLQMAADSAMGPLARLLRSAELAGHDPARTLTDAVTSRPLDGAESAARVLHSRINTALAGQLNPRGNTFTDRLPAAEGLWSVRMGEWAEMADDRRRQLGDELAAEPPRWATTTFGPVPDDPMHRTEWQERASTVAAYREMNDVTGNDAALGPAPKPGQVEAHAAWHAAWRAMGRPEADREEAEMSNGQLRMRVRAYQREENWAPAYVADEMEGTHREVAELRQRQTLALAGSGAWTEADSADLSALEERAADLRAADDSRAAWYVHTSPTRASADRARAALSDRGLDPDQPDDAATPAEWLAAHEPDQAEADRYRPVHAEDLARHQPAAEDVHPDAVETAVPDIRDASTPHSARTDEGTARIPSADETAAAVQRAQAALVEIHNRRTQEEARSTYETEPADWAQEAHDAAARQVAVDEELVEV